MAGTHSVIEARDIAVKQVEQSEQQLISVINVIRKLKEDIETEKNIIHLVNKVKEVQEAVTDAQNMKEVVEKTYEAEKKYASLLTALALAGDLDADYKREETLMISIESLTGIRDERLNGEKRKVKIDDPDGVTDLPIEQCRSASAVANNVLAEAQLRITKQKRVFVQLENGLKEYEISKNDTETSLAKLENEAIEDERECSLLFEVLSNTLNSVTLSCFAL